MMYGPSTLKLFAIGYVMVLVAFLTVPVMFELASFIRQRTRRMLNEQPVTPIVIDRDRFAREFWRHD